jgi:hypothetical protein
MVLVYLEFITNPRKSKMLWKARTDAAFREGSFTINPSVFLFDVKCEMER